jgi:hypothetical protein
VEMLGSDPGFIKELSASGCQSDPTAAALE